MAGAPLLRICVTGPESTGKTTLACRLAAWAATESVPEASRLYAARKGAALTADDVGPIAREHIALADAAAERARNRGAGSLVLDTDLVSTVIYARHYYGAAPRWVEQAESARRADLYLLCDVDIPWIPDGIRDSPAHRDVMFEQFRAALARRGAMHEVIRGDRARRWDVARRAVEQVQGIRA